MSTFDQRMILSVADQKAEMLSEDLVHVLCQMTHWEFAGSIRRRSHTVGDLDLILVPPEEGDLLGNGTPVSLDSLPWPEWVTVKEKKAYGWYTPHGASRVMLDAFTCPEASVGAMRWFLTGPPDLNVYMRQKATEKGWLLNQYGVFVAVPSPTPKYPQRVVPGDRIDQVHVDYDQQEHEISRTLGLRFVPPAKRDEWRRLMFGG